MSLSNLIVMGSSTQVDNLDEDNVVVVHEGQLDANFSNTYQLLN